MSGVAIIQGASRGIGLQFCKTILTTKPNCRIVAACRDPSGAVHLHDLQKQHGDR